MSGIIFEGLILQNFGGIAEAELSLENRGLLLIQGRNEDDPSANSNGAGKSSLADGFCWTLYGETARGVTGDAVVNRSAEKNCMGQVAFRDGKDEYVVTRYRKHKTGKNRLCLSQNGTDITKGTDKLTQEALEKIIGCPYDVFVASIYAGQEQMPNLPGMTDKELKTLIEEAAGVRVLESAYEIARKRASETDKNVTAKAALVTHAERSLLNAEMEISNAQLEFDKWETERTRKADEADALTQSKMRQAQTVAKTLEEMGVPAIEASIEDLNAKIAAVSKPPPAPVAPSPPAPLPAFVPPPTPLPDPQRSEIERKIIHLQASIDLLGTKREVLLHALRNLTASVGTLCGECGKEYAAADLEGRKEVIRADGINVRNKILQAEGDLATLQAAMAKMDETHQRLLETHKRVVEQRASERDAEQAALTAAFEVERKAHQQALDAHRAACASLDTPKLLAALKDAQMKLQRAAELRSDIRTHAEAARAALQRAKDLRAETNPWEAEIARRDAEHARLKSEVEQAVKRHEEAVAAHNVHAQAAEVFAPNGVRGEILDTVTPFLNDRTSAYLGALSDGNITATWNTLGETGKGELREKFHIAVTNTNGADSFQGQSGGERRKVRIATAMALQDLVASRAYKPIKLFIADEIDDALDVSGLERLMGILEDKARAVGTVLLVSHNSLSDWCRNEVTMVKKDGVSRLEAA